MTLLELRNWVRTFLQEDTPTHWINTELNRSINDAIIRVAKVAPSDLLGTLMGKNLLTAAQGSGVWDLPADFLIFKAATLNNEKWATRIQIEEVVLLNKNPFYLGTVDSPKCYIWENKMMFSPTSGTPHLYYVKIPAILTANGDESPLNSVLDRGVVLLATSDAFTKDDIDQSNKYLQLFLETMKEVCGE